MARRKRKKRAEKGCTHTPIFVKWRDLKKVKIKGMVMKTMLTSSRQIAPPATPFTLLMKLDKNYH